MHTNRTFESRSERARPVKQKMQAEASSSKATRIPALDFTKGALVLFMVFYHWVNYNVGPRWPYYRYLRFLTPSFIFITGFMISNVYLSKYHAGDSRLVKRLSTRGLKLMAVFIILNILRNFLVQSGGGVVPNLLEPENLIATFITGTFTSKVVAFYILVPIAYLLILSGILMVPLRVCRYSFHVICVSLFAVILMLYLNGRNNQNLEIVAIGMLGILAGFTPIAVVNKIVRHRYVLGLLYLLYTMAITKWNVPYPLEIVGTYLTVTIIYLVGTIGSKSNWMGGKLALLGKYSLLGYISQIPILQMLAATLRHLNVRGAALVISLPAGFALTVITVEIVHRTRAKAASIDRLYRVVFN